MLGVDQNMSLSISIYHMVADQEIRELLKSGDRLFTLPLQLPFISSLQQLLPCKCLCSTWTSGALVSSGVSWHCTSVHNGDMEEVACKDTFPHFAANLSWIIFFSSSLR